MTRLFPAIAATTFAAAFFSCPAAGQTAAAKVDTVDENGVNLATLAVTPQNDGEDIAIGAGAFPSRLSVSRTTLPWTGMFGGGAGSNLDIFIGGGQVLTRLQPENFNIEITVGRIKRSFRSDGTVGAQGITFLPLDGGGGYVIKSTEGTTKVYTYYSSTGEELRFVISDAAVCGRYAFTTGVQNITCARISKWTAPNGVIGNFTYNTRSELFGYYGETDLQSVSNTLGLTLTIGYTRYKDSGHNTTPAFGATSILASSNQLGICNAQASCSRSSTYQYIVPPPIDPNVLDQTNITLTRFTNPRGDAEQYLYSGQTTQHYPTLQSVRRPANPSVDAVSIIYGSPLKLVDSLGNAWSYSRSVSGPPYNHVTTVRTDPLNKTRVYEFDADGNLVRFQDEMTQTTTWGYDALGRVSSTNLPSGVVIVPEYDARGNVKSVTKKATPAGSAPNIVTTAQFSLDCTNPKICNEPISATDALNNVTDYTYDPAHGGVLTVTLPPAAAGSARPQTRFTYGVVSGAYTVTGTSTCRTTASCAGTADETKVILGYGANGLLPTSRTVRSGDGSVESSVSDAYDAFGNLVSEDGPLPGSADTVYARYDQLGRAIGQIGPDASGAGSRAASRVAYDANGHVTQAEIGVVSGVGDADWAAFVPKHAVTSIYDTNGRKTVDTVTGGGSTFAVRQYSYDAASRLDCATIRMNSGTWGTLPPSACTAQAVGGAGPDRITKYGYDAADRQTKVTNGYGTSSQADTVSTAYTNSGQVLSATDAKGNVTTYGYDGFDRLRTTTYPGGSFEQLGYDANGNVLSRRLRDGAVIGLTYDGLNQVTAKTLPNGEAGATYSYDLAGHPLTATQGTTLTYAWDALGRLKSETQPFGSLAYQYDSAGNRTRTTWQDAFYVSYAYDNASHLTAIKENGSASLATFTYDELGRRKTLTRGNGVVTTYGFDAASRLAVLGSELPGTADDQNVTFEYNPSGQISSRTRSNTSYAFTGYVGVTVNRPYVANGLNQYTSAGDTSFGYDARGNLTTSGTTTYAYTSENMLKSKSGGISLYYDPALRLVEYNTSVSTRFIYDGGQIAAEIANPSGAVTKRYVFGPGTDEPLVEYDASGNKTYLIADERGSIVAQADASGVVTRNSYDEYGIPAGNQSRFGYTGQAWFPELGLAYYKARFYSPPLGRFMQTDPIGYGDGMNWYNYAGADPINGSDPSGLQSCPPGDLCTTGPGTPPSQPGADNRPAYGPGDGGARWDFGGWGALRGLVRNAPINRSGLSTAASPPQKARFTCPLGVLNAAMDSSVGGVQYDTPMEKKALSDWAHGRTATLRLGQDYLGRVTSFYAAHPNQAVALPSQAGDPSGSFRARITFAGVRGSTYTAEPTMDGLLGQATILFDSSRRAIGLWDNFDFNAGARGDLIEGMMADIRRGRSLWCGTSGSFPIRAGVAQ